MEFEQLETGVQEQEAADPVESEQAQIEEPAEPQSEEKQTAEQNALFAEQRRKQELDTIRQQLKREKEQRTLLEQAASRTEQILDRYGYAGSLQEKLDFLEAAQRSVEPESVRREREAEQGRLSEVQRIAQETELAKQEAEYFRNREVERLMREDLSKVQKLDPKIKSLNELGEPFFRMISSGVDAETAYHAIKATLKPNNPSSGDINTTTTPEKEFYTKEEVAKMSQSEVEKNYDKIRKSMNKWR